MQSLLYDLFDYILDNYEQIIFGVILIIATLVLYSMLSSHKTFNDSENDTGNVVKNEFTDLPEVSDNSSNSDGTTITFEALTNNTNTNTNTNTNNCSVFYQISK